MAPSLVGSLNIWLLGLVACWLVAWLPCLIGHSVRWLLGWPAGLWVRCGWLVGWLASRLACCVAGVSGCVVVSAVGADMAVAPERRRSGAKAVPGWRQTGADWRRLAPGSPQIGAECAQPPKLRPARRPASSHTVRPPASQPTSQSSREARNERTRPLSSEACNQPSTQAARQAANQPCGQATVKANRGGRRRARKQPIGTQRDKHASGEASSQPTTKPGSQSKKQNKLSGGRVDDRVGGRAGGVGPSGAWLVDF